MTWGSDLPVRYAIRVFGDSVSLADVAWVYPTLPTTGGGRMILDIRNERNLHQLDYALSEMDVRTTKSRLRGGDDLRDRRPRARRARREDAWPTRWTGISCAR